MSDIRVSTPLAFEPSLSEEAPSTDPSPNDDGPTTDPATMRTLKSVDGKISRDIHVKYLLPFDYFKTLCETKDAVFQLPISAEHLTDVITWINIQKGRPIPPPPKPVTTELMKQLDTDYPEEMKFVRDLFSSKRQVYCKELALVAHKYTIVSLESFLLVLFAAHLKGKPIEYVRNYFKMHRKVRD